MTKNEQKDHKSALEKLNERQNEAKMIRKIVFYISVAVFFIAVLLLGGGYFYIKSALKPVDPDNKTEITVEIPIGSGVSTISQILEDKGVVKDAKVFKYYVKFNNESGFMAGDYKMNPSMTIPQIVKSLKTGKVMKEVVFKMTIPEGKQLEEIATIISEKTGRNADEVFQKLNDRSFIDSLQSQYPEILTDEMYSTNIKYPLEGYLFPATYSFYEKSPTLEEIVTVMLTKTQAVIDKYRGEMEEKQMTVHQLLTMSSLIEEEATKKVDREKIASVFYNRLSTGMPLQTDPTILYAKGEHSKKVYYKDLEIDSPYNTYTHTGLTPGPIANAGESSIEAALNPADTDFLYFLATADGDILYSTTLEEHNEYKQEHISGDGE